jgi:orotate phosphoribosyltransferase
MDVVSAHGGEGVGVGVIGDRSAGKVDFGVPLESIISMEVVSYEAGECPLCKLGTPAVRPGSRGIR